MNCRPGDLAVVVAVDLPHQEAYIGRIIRVTQAYYSEPGQCMAWRYEGPRLSTPLGGECLGLYDWELRPIRDPGDDARDQTLDWLPSPVETA